MHRAVNRVDMVTVLEAYSKKGAEKETCPKKNRFKKPIQQTCFMKRIQETVHVLQYVVLLGNQVAETQQVARLYFALLLEVDRIQQELTPQPQCRRSMSCTEHLFHCTVSFSLLANSLT